MRQLPARKREPFPRRYDRRISRAGPEWTIGFSEECLPVSGRHKRIRFWGRDRYLGRGRYVKGTWEWNVTDIGPKTLHRNLPPDNAGLLVNLKGISPWAAANANADGLVWAPQIYRGSSSYPKNMDDWRNYLSRLMTRYRGVVQYYETPSEANHEMKLSPKDILATNRAIYETVKRLDPKAKVVGPTTAGTDTMAEWTGEYMNIGEKRSPTSFPAISTGSRNPS